MKEKISKDGSISMTNPLATPGVNMGIYREIYLGSKTFNISNGSGQKFDILLPAGVLQGWIEVDIIAGWVGTATALGRMLKYYGTGLNTDGGGFQSSRYILTDGSIAGHIALSDIKTSEEKGRYITVASRTTNNLPVNVVVRTFSRFEFNLNQIKLSEIYIDAEEFDKPMDLSAKLKTPLTWYEPVYQNGFMEGNANLWEKLQYAKDETNNVYIAGVTRPQDIVGSWTTIFTLPSGYRPKINLRFPTATEPATGNTMPIGVFVDGRVAISSWLYTQGGGVYIAATFKGV